MIGLSFSIINFVSLTRAFFWIYISSNFLSNLYSIILVLRIRTLYATYFCRISPKDSFFRFRCELAQMLLAVDHKTPTSKDVKEMYIGFSIIQTLVWSLFEALADDASALNEEICRNCFGPKVRRQICGVEHKPHSFYKSYFPSFYHTILLRYIWCREVVIDLFGHQEVIQKSICELCFVVTSYLSDGKHDLKFDFLNEVFQGLWCFRF